MIKKHMAYIFNSYIIKHNKNIVNFMKVVLYNFFFFFVTILCNKVVQKKKYFDDEHFFIITKLCHQKCISIF